MILKHKFYQPTGPLLGLLLLASALVWTGCATSVSRMPVRIGPGGIPTAFKRVERTPQRDFIHHWVRTAYLKPARNFAAPPKSDQASTMKELGAPDWMRKPFRSLQNERVEEWVYLDAGQMFQFVGTQRVFEGPLTDLEQKLIERGYPDWVQASYPDSGNNLDIFVYYNLFWPVQEEFHFVNGQLTEFHEGN
jgi:hypothetical protein